MGIGKGSGRGGSRAGAGRKTVDGLESVGSATVSMNEETEQLFHELGNGNYSLGARRAAAELLFYRAGGHIVKTIPKAADFVVLQSTTKRRGGLNSPTQQEELPVDLRAVYD